MPHQVADLALLKLGVDALHQVFDLFEGRVPQLLVGEQRFVSREQPDPLSVGSLAKPSLQADATPGRNRAGCADAT